MSWVLYTAIPRQEDSKSLVFARDIGSNTGLGVCRGWGFFVQMSITDCPFALKVLHTATATAMKSPKLPHATIKVAYRADSIPRRHTRGFASSLQAFTYGDNASLQKVEQAGKRDQLSEDESSLSSLRSETVFDIEDTPFQASSPKKRKRGFDSPSTTVASISTATSTRTSPRKAGVKEDLSALGTARKAKRQPAKRILNQEEEEEVVPPAKWKEIYDAVREMRKEKLAPVDTMGCETLAEEHLTPRVSRAELLFRILLKLYLGQTFPNPHSPYALLPNQRHDKRNCYAPIADRASLPRSYTRKYIRSGLSQVE